MVEKKPAKVAKKAAAKRAPAKASTAPKLRPGKATPKSPSKPIDTRITELADWRRKTLSRVRVLIMQADPDVVEESKWRKPSNAMAGVPVWSHDGIICTGETYKDKVKLRRKPISS